MFWSKTGFFIKFQVSEVLIFGFLKSELQRLETQKSWGPGDLLSGFLKSEFLGLSSPDSWVSKAPI